jgi:hypothetical protein
MRFKRYPRHEAYNISRQRRAAAERAVAKEKEKCGLFPEMAKYQTADERLAANELSSREALQRMRDFNARGWRRARRELTELRPPKVSNVIGRPDFCPATRAICWI